MNALSLIVVWVMLCNTLEAGTDKYMTEALGYPDLISLSMACQHHKAVRGIRVVDASSWGFHATDLIETKIGFHVIDRHFNYYAPYYEGSSKAGIFPLTSKDLAAVLQAFAAKTKKELLADLPQGSSSVIDGESLQISVFFHSGEGYEFFLPAERVSGMGQAKRGVLHSLLDEIHDIRMRYTKPFEK